LNAHSAINALIQYLTGTGEFIHLRQTQREIAQNPGLRSRLAQFRRAQETLAQSPPQGSGQTLAEALRREYEELNAVPELRRYFQAAEQFDALVSNLWQTAWETLNGQLEKESA
jgi:cell fate (sporulation/competence/biofilm development) regulator YlbF (YheA/YmcA/DUF963 family)